MAQSRACLHSAVARDQGASTHVPLIPSFPFLKKDLPQHNSLVSARVPDVLEEAVALGEAVHAVVALAHGADEAAEGVDLVLASVTAVLVNLGDRDLDGAVVLGLDDAVGRAALAGDVPAQGNHRLVYILYIWPHLGFLETAGLSRALGRHSGVRLQVDKLAAVVLHFDGCVGGERRVWAVWWLRGCLIVSVPFGQVGVASEREAVNSRVGPAPKAAKASYVT
jgi:hypothetical protein